MRPAAQSPLASSSFAPLRPSPSSLALVRHLSYGRVLSSPYQRPPPLPSHVGSSNPHYERVIEMDPPGNDSSLHKLLLWALIGINVYVWNMWQEAKEGTPPAPGSQRRDYDPKATEHLRWMRHHFTTSKHNLDEGRYHTLITHAFSHQGGLHLLVNMASLYFLLPSVMATIGAPRTLMVFLGSACLGAVTQLVYGTEVVPRMWPPKLGLVEKKNGDLVYAPTYDVGGVGASAGAMGLAVVFASLFPRTKVQLMLIPIPIPARVAIGGLIVMDVLSSARKEGGPMGANVAHWAHLGGALFGGIYYLLRLRGRKFLHRPWVDSRYFYRKTVIRDDILSKQRQEWLTGGSKGAGAAAGSEVHAAFTPKPRPGGGSGSSVPPPSAASSWTPSAHPSMPPASTSARAAANARKFKRTTPSSISAHTPKNFSTLTLQRTAGALSSSRSLHSWAPRNISFSSLPRRSFASQSSAVAAAASSPALTPLPPTFSALCLSSFVSSASSLPSLSMVSRSSNDVTCDLAADEVVVAMEYASVNPSDAKNSLGFMRGITTLPRVMGRDFSGKVVRGGQGSQAQSLLLRGASVFGTGGDLGFIRDGTHAQYVKLKVSEVTERPNALSAIQAGCIGVNYCTAAHGLERAQLNSNDVVLVTGANGGVGSAVVQLAKLAGASVIAVERSRKAGAGDHTTTLSAASSEADATIYLSDLPQAFADLPAAVRNLPLIRDAPAAASGHTRRLGATLIFDVLGGDTVPHLLSSLATGGRMVCIAMPLPPTPVQLDGLELYRQELQLLGINSLRLSASDCANILGKLAPAYDSGKLRLRSSSTTVVSPAQIGQAYADVLSGQAKGKIVLGFQQS